MKLLIIAGPYEADRIRKSAVAAGFETVAVEPGESLSGWITASRPQLIVMAPQMVNADPALALAKVRSVPRGRVPIFLVGDEADEPRMASLSEGFFVRPVSPEALLEHAKVVLAAERARESTNLGQGHEFAPRGGRGTGSAPRPAPLPGQTAPLGPRPAVGLRPLVATVGAQPPSAGSAKGAGDASVLLAALDAGIDALLDAELTSALAATPKVAGPEAEFSTQRTADMKTDDLPKRKPAERPADTNGTAAVHPPEPRPLGPSDETPRPDDSRARVLSRYAFVEVGDYFQVLGVGRDATPEELKRAHDRIARELAPEQLGPRLASELGAQIEAIRAVAEEALRVLGDTRLRARYSARL
jgi:hypothetical protein